MMKKNSQFPLLIYFEMSEQTHLNKLSLIIPVFNEEVFLKENISSFTSLQNIEIIFVDGGSGDSTRQILENHGLKIILSPVASRSYQMNLGARLATGNILLFLHGDSLLPNNYFEDINFILSQNRVIAGAFNLKINHDSLSLYLISVLVKLRSHLFSLPYGDQGFFLKKKKLLKPSEVFLKLPLWKTLPSLRSYKKWAK